MGKGGNRMNGIEKITGLFDAVVQKVFDALTAPALALAG